MTDEDDIVLNDEAAIAQAEENGVKDKAPEFDDQFALRVAMMRKESSGIEQKEGLCHMRYECEKCGHTERIWNSRPRVTPFTVPCSNPECDKGTMQHINFGRDFYDPNYQPKKGERIFVDWSIEACEKFRREYIEEHWDKGSYPMVERTDLWKTKEEALQYFLDQWEFGQPHIITI